MTKKKSNHIESQYVQVAIRALASRYLSQTDSDARSGSIGLRPECDGILGWQMLVGKKIHAGVGFQWIVADGSESPTPGTGT